MDAVFLWNQVKSIIERKERRTYEEFLDRSCGEGKKQGKAEPWHGPGEEKTRIVFCKKNNNILVGFMVIL